MIGPIVHTKQKTVFIMPPLRLGRLREPWIAWLAVPVHAEIIERDGSKSLGIIVQDRFLRRDDFCPL